MAKVVAGSVRAGEAVAGKATAGQEQLNAGTIYATPIYTKESAQVDLTSTDTIAVGDTDAVIGGPEAYIGRSVDSYHYVQAADWASPASYTKTS